MKNPNIKKCRLEKQSEEILLSKTDLFGLNDHKETAKSSPRGI